MTTDRDKFLTEAMGLCWHEIEQVPYGFVTLGRCKKCLWNELQDNLEFSDWPGFGLLWEWAEKQDWWDKWPYTSIDKMICQHIISPSRFSDVVYEYLKGIK